MEKQSSQETNVNAQNDHYAESEIKKVLDHLAHAIRDGKLEEIMKFYSDHVVAFDMMPPLQFTEKNKFKKSWDICFTSYFKFPVNFDFIEQKIFAHGDVAFSHGLIHMTGTTRSGQEVQSWLRNTTCLRKIDDHWVITHEHNSVPLDMETDKGLKNLSPHEAVH